LKDNVFSSEGSDAFVEKTYPEDVQADIKAGMKKCFEENGKDFVCCVVLMIKQFLCN